MNKIFKTALKTILIFAIASAIVQAAPAPPVIKAKAAILMDPISGEILYQKNCHEKRAPASTTKIMTALVALDNAGLDTVFTASKNASDTEQSSIHLVEGEEMTLGNILYGLMLRSGNDAAICIAENIGGSQEGFVQMMNDRAAQLGAKDTHFVNPNGLHNKDHYTTAYDLALIARAAIKNKDFNKIVKTKTATIDRSINKKDVLMKNTAGFLWDFKGADGIKTGFTSQAGHCFVGSATRGRWRLITVVLGSPKAGDDTAALLEYGFKYYQSIPFARTDYPVKTLSVPGGVTKEVALVPSRDFGLTIRKSNSTGYDTEINTGKKAPAPVKKGDKLGEMVCYLNGREVGTVDLVAASDVDRTAGATVWHWTKKVLATSGILLIGFIAYGTAVAEASRRRRRRLKKRSRKINNGR